MRKETINIFAFEELSEEAQEKVIREFWDINLHYEWWEFTYEDAERVNIKIEGFSIDRGWSIDIKLLSDLDGVLDAILYEHGEATETAKLAREYKAKMNILVSRLDRVYNVINAIDQKFPGYWNPEEIPHKFADLYDYCEELEGEIEEEMEELESDFIHEIGQAYLVILSNEYEWRISEDAIVDTIQANEYEFTEDGSQY